MRTVEIKLLGRVAMDQAFLELWATTTQVETGTVSVAPVVPISSAGQELVVEVRPADGSVNFAMFDTLPPEPAAEGDAEPGAEPVGVRLTACSGVYAAFPRQVRRAPFLGSLVALCATGTPKPSA